MLHYCVELSDRSCDHHGNLCIITGIPATLGATLKPEDVSTFVDIIVGHDAIDDVITKLGTISMPIMPYHSMYNLLLQLEAIPESLKNMMLVMTTTGVFDGCHSNLIDVTWSKLNEFVPQLQAELNPPLPSSSHKQLNSELDQQPSVSTEEDIAATEQKATNNGMGFDN